MTADYAYFRLRDEGYTPDDIKRWADTIARETASCRTCSSISSTKTRAKGPEFAQLLMKHLGIATNRDVSTSFDVSLAFGCVVRWSTPCQNRS